VPNVHNPRFTRIVVHAQLLEDTFRRLMFLEEKPHLQPLPLEGFRFFQQETRTVDDAGLVQVDSSYYAALPAPLYSEVTVRIYEREIEILDQQGQPLRRHERLYTGCRLIGQQNTLQTRPAEHSACGFDSG